MNDVAALQTRVNKLFASYPLEPSRLPYRTSKSNTGPSSVDIPFWSDATPIAPAVISSKVLERIATASRDLLDGIDILLHASASREYLTEISRFTPEERELCDERFRTDYLALARADLIVAGDRIGITELNSTSRFGGGIERDLLIRKLESLPTFRNTVTDLNLKNEPVFPRISDLISRLAAQQGTPGICIAAGHRLTEVPDSFLADVLSLELRSAGVPLVVAGLEELHIEHEQVRHLAFGPVGVIYRLFGPWGRSQPDPQHRLRCLRSASANGKVAVLDGFVGECRVTKLPLTLLSDKRWLELLPSDLAERIFDTVLWTRLLQDSRTDYEGTTVNLMSFAENNRHELVLKPGRGTGGIGLIVGAEVSQAEWESQLAWALHGREPWVVQKVMRPDVLNILQCDVAGNLRTVDHIVSYGAVLIDRHFAGLMRRNGNPDGLNLNTIQGSTNVPVYASESE